MELKNTLFKGDCLEVMKKFPDQSFDMILCDLPYGTTACKWDTIIPFEPLWKEYNRISKTDGAIVLFGAEPFSSILRVSNIKNFKYDWIWKKDKATGHLNAKKQPMRQTEMISVFYREQCKYNPQLMKKNPKDIRPATTKRKNTGVYGNMDAQSIREIPIDMGYPKNILEFNSCLENGDKGLHPTQKPVSLFEYLIKTYTNEGDLILDNCCGSGTTGVAALNTNRYFTMIEKEEEYYNITIDRIKKHKESMNLERKG